MMQSPERTQALQPTEFFGISKDVLKKLPEMVRDYAENLEVQAQKLMVELGVKNGRELLESIRNGTLPMEKLKKAKQVEVIARQLAKVVEKKELPTDLEPEWKSRILLREAESFAQEKWNGGDDWKKQYMAKASAEIGDVRNAEKIASTLPPKFAYPVYITSARRLLRDGKKDEAKVYVDRVFQMVEDGKLNEYPEEVFADLARLFVRLSGEGEDAMKVTEPLFETVTLQQYDLVIEEDIRGSIHRAVASELAAMVRDGILEVALLKKAEEVADQCGSFEKSIALSDIAVAGSKYHPRSWVQSLLRKAKAAVRDDDLWMGAYAHIVTKSIAVGEVTFADTVAREMRDADDHDSRGIEALKELAQEEARSHDIPEAMSYLAFFNRGSPERAETFGGIVKGIADSGDMDLAFTEVKKIKKSPKIRDDVYRHFAKIYAEQKNIEQAKQMLQEILDDKVVFYALCDIATALASPAQ